MNRVFVPARVAPVLLTLFVAACGGSHPPATGAASTTAPTSATSTSAEAARASGLVPPIVKKPAYPASARHRVTDNYYRDHVIDDYQWLENGDDGAVKAWTEAQGTFARTWLDGIPQRKAVRARLEELMAGGSPTWGNVVARKGAVFALKMQPPKQHPILVVMPALDDTKDERVVLDPDVFDTSGGSAIDFYAPSYDGKLVAISISKGGSEAGDMHVVEVATGKLREIVPRVNAGTAGGSVAWRPDDTGFFYTRYPRPGERPVADLYFYQQVWFHKLGAERDTYALGHDSPRIAEWKLEASVDGKTLLGSMAYGDGGDHEQWALVHGARWEPVAMRRDNVRHVTVGHDGLLYLLSFDGAPRGKVLRTSATMPEINRAEAIVPEGDGVIEQILPTATRLYLLETVAGISRVRSVPIGKGAAAAKKPMTVAGPALSTYSDLVSLGGDDVAFEAQSYTEPQAWFRVSGKDGAVTRTNMVTTSPADFTGVEVVRETCTSKDGTSVPLTVLRPKGAKMDGATPTLLYGYGAYGISQTPTFRPSRLAWLEQGGVMAVANLRGGGELGEAWHHAGNLTKKQTTFDDLYACAVHLGEAKYTSAEHLAILGASAGGLLMGAAMTQHPEAYKAVVARVGWYDMLRVERDANGAFNVTEFGTVTDPKQYEALSGYSPYQHVKDGAAYPAVLFMTGANDMRVNPYHSRKMAARMQGATSSEAPVLLRISGNTGHGQGSPLGAQVEEWADTYAFLFQQLGMASAH